MNCISDIADLAALEDILTEDLKRFLRDFIEDKYSMWNFNLGPPPFEVWFRDAVCAYFGGHFVSDSEVEREVLKASLGDYFIDK